MRPFDPYGVPARRACPLGLLIGIKLPERGSTTAGFDVALFLGARATGNVGPSLLVPVNATVRILGFFFGTSADGIGFEAARFSTWMVLAFAAFSWAARAWVLIALSAAALIRPLPAGGAGGSPDEEEAAIAGAMASSC